MREFLNEHTIANSIRQARELLSSTFLIVEGDTDSRVYKNFFGDNDCRTQVAHNKDNAINALKILQNENFKGVLAIVDADFDILEEKDYENQSLFLTDFHDLECIIFVSPAFEKVLSEFGSENKIEKFEKYKIIRETIFEIISFVGYLRWISLSERLNLKFEEIDFGKFVKRDDLTFDLELLITTVKNKSHRPDIDNAQIVEKINLLSSQKHDKRQVSCGKDLVEVLTIGLQRVLGTKSKENPIDSKRIGQSLRLAYEFEFFTATELYNNVKEWENKNQPFKVFR
jgi:hypothetical protein